MENSTEHPYTYEAAPSDDGAASADELTLAGDEDLPLSPEELAFADPLHDEKLQAQLEAKHSPKKSLSGKIREWVSRPRGYLDPTRQELDTTATEAELGLLQIDERGDAVPTQRWSLTTQQTIGWLVWLLPSFTHHFFVKSNDKEIRRPTDYLDGMRGIASLFVFFDHYLAGLYTNMEQHGYGDGENLNIFQLPFIRVFYSGSAMVSIFFVISGFVLSQRCIVAFRAQKHEKLNKILTSMAFRRALRLFMPSLAISFICFLMSIAGFIPPPDPHWTFAGECLRYWNYLFEHLFRLFAYDVNYQGWYSYQLWTIPREFVCSMALFVLVLVVARCKVRTRFAVEALILVYLFYRDRWDIATFLGGMIIAEIDVIRNERKAVSEAARENLDNEPAKKPGRTSRLLCFSTTSLLWAVFVAGWYISGYPHADADETPGYDVFANIWQDDWSYKQRFWLAIGAMMMIFAASFVREIQWFFSTPIARYFGKISYALYLVHGVLNRTVRLWLWSVFWTVLQYETEEGDDAKFDGGWIMGTILYFPIVFWCADIFWRAVDQPSVDFAKWVESKCFAEEKQQ